MSMRKASYTVAILVISVINWPSLASEFDWSESQSTRDYYNRAASLKWRQRLGDWIDASGQLHGDQPFAVTEVPDRGAEFAIRLDVTSLVRAWLSGEIPNQGILLRSNRGALKIRSREHARNDVAPTLVLTTVEGSYSLTPAQDTTLYNSTGRALGNREELELSGKRHTLLAFDLGSVAQGEILEARLELSSFAQYGKTTLEVYAVTTEPGIEEGPRMGVAAGFPNDEGIANHQNVLFFEGFDKGDWRKRWRNDGTAPQTVDPVAKGIPALSGKAIDATIPEGRKTGLNLYRLFNSVSQSQLQSMYLRYYLFLTESFAEMAEGGKLPGIAGTYDVAGWGGRRSTGTNGWSARGLFGQVIPAGTPLAGRIPFGTYLYHADMKGVYGDNEFWNNNRLGQLETGRWYSIEQQITLNDEGRANGILRGWVDGRLAYENTSVRFRTTPDVGIDRVWLNVYHGGTISAPADLGVYLDNVVIAREYIGPRVSR